jgi:type IV pilus assembly protein PilP
MSPVRITIAILASILLIGCAEHKMDDLSRFVENVHKDKKPRVEPLPRIKPHETFTYTAAKLTDPFSTGNLRQSTPMTGGSGISPDLTRRKEPLEQFPLDSLSMVGTLARGDMIWAVIRAPDDTIHRAQSGNYIGQNHGKIEKVTAGKLVVNELVPGGNNNWVEREASIAIVR